MNKLTKIFLTGTAMFLFTAASVAQDFPPNAEPGKCYMKCRKNAVWKTETETVRIKDASKVLTTTPARYETRTETIKVKEAYKKLVTVPATFKTVTETVLIKEAGKKLVPVAAKYETRTETKKVEDASTKWVQQKDEMCKSSNSDDCMVWCLVETPAQFKTITKRVLVSPATTREVEIPAQYKTVTKTVVDKPATTREVEVPAQFKTVTKRVMVEGPKVVEKEIPAEFKTITKRVLVTPAGMGGFVEVDCNTVKVAASGDKIADYSIADLQRALLNKGYNLGSYGANNEFNEATRKALVKFQRDKGIAVGGFNDATLRALGLK